MGPRCSPCRRVRARRELALLLLGTSGIPCGGRWGAARAGEAARREALGPGCPGGPGSGLLYASLRPSLRESCGVGAQRRPAFPFSCRRGAEGLPWQPCWPARGVLVPALGEGPRGKTVWEPGRQASRDGNVKEASRHYTGFSACGGGPGVPQGLCRHGSGSARCLLVFLSFPQASKKK